jgi:hypothetical protein
VIGRVLLFVGLMIEEEYNGGPECEISQSI